MLRTATGSREKKMKKIILTIAGSALIALSTVQLAAASEHQDRAHHRAHTGAQFRDTNAYAAPVQPEWSGYSYSGGYSAPAGR
jgi:Ni/Co efflux regulator RcnB